MHSSPELALQEKREKNLKGGDLTKLRHRKVNINAIPAPYKINRPSPAGEVVKKEDISPTKKKRLNQVKKATRRRK